MQGAALVTGGSAGIGYAIAHMLAADGWAVTVCGRDADKLASAVRELGPRAHAVAANLARSGAAESVLAEHLDRHGQLDLLVNNVGSGGLASIETKKDKALDLELNLNFRVAFQLLRASIPSLRESAATRGKSNVVNVSSLVARQTPPNVSVYAATKAALVALSNSAHGELSRDGIHVTALLPGFVDTPGASWASAAQDTMITADDVAESVRFLLRTSPRCFVPELMLTTSGPTVLHSPVDWETPDH
ncbi:SDR family oxidoreductase [Gordonia sp. OPL2]|nr:SDR family oxidoreductase [Gordonia sp. OPL2]